VRRYSCSLCSCSSGQAGGPSQASRRLTLFARQATLPLLSVESVFFFFFAVCSLTGCRDYVPTGEETSRAHGQLPVQAAPAAVQQPALPFAEQHQPGVSQRQIRRWRKWSPVGDSMSACTPGFTNAGTGSLGGSRVRRCRERHKGRQLLGSIGYPQLGPTSFGSDSEEALAMTKNLESAVQHGTRPGLWTDSMT